MELRFWLTNVTPITAVIAPITTTEGDTSPARIAASPITRAPMTVKVCPIELGSRTPASRKISRSINSTNISNCGDSGRPMRDTDMVAINRNGIWS